MGYSLLDKFRGAWLGSIIGQKLAILNQGKKIANSNLNLFDGVKLNDIQQQSFLWSREEIALIMQKRCQLPEIKDTAAFNAIEGDNLDLDPQVTEIALSILPLIFYYHDYWHYLSNFISQQGQSLQKSQAEIENILIWCYVVRLALRGELTSHNLTNRVVMGTGLKQQSSIWWLKKIEVHCIKGFSSRQLIKELSPRASLEIPLSLFCFLSNPEDFHLTVRQALSWEKKTSNVTTLSSILSGASNGLTGIPVNWRNLCQHQEFYQQIMSETEKTIEQWLGSDCLGKTKAISCVIDAPKTLQRRSNLKIISQQEYESL